MNTPYQDALAQLEEVANIISLDPKVLATLQKPERVISVSVPVEMDDGSFKIYDGYRVQYNSARGPYKGGIRYYQTADLEEVKALGLWMVLKTALLDLPLGGSKGGITVDPKQLSVEEVEKMTRSFTRRLAPFIGPEIDIPAPDVNTNPEVMRWISDEYSKVVGQDTPGVVTGKPLEHGGSEGRGTATAKGGFYVLEELAKYLNLEPASTRVVIQGFGNAGYYFAQFVHEAGYKVVGVSDSKGGIYQSEGLDPDAVMAHKTQTGSVAHFPDAQDVTNEELLIQECELLVPAALEQVITQKNAGELKAKAVLELANGPTTPEADQILHDKKVIVIPDILANAGGVTVSYFEWQQNLSGDKWSEEEVFTKLEPMMKDAFKQTMDHAEKHQVRPRMGAYVAAIERLKAPILQSK